jgi:putative membrane protein
MSEPISPEPGDLGPPERLHPLFLLSGLGRFVRGLSGAYAFVAYLLVSGQFATALLLGIAALAVTAVSVVLYWQSFQFRIGASEIRIDHGILSRTHRSIPFDRVTDVDIVQGPFARLLGLAEVKFDTGGGGAKEEGRLSAVTLQRAHELRALVRSRRAFPVEAAPLTAAEEDRPVYALDLPRLLLAGLFNFSLALFAGLFGLSQTLGGALGFDPLSEQFWRDVLTAGNPVTEALRSHRALALTAGVVLLVVIGAVTGIVRTFLRHHGFRVDRTPAGLRRRSGLLTLTDVTLPIRRVQAAIVASGPIRSAFGWSEFRLQNLAAEHGEGGDHLIAPLARDEEVESILKVLGWALVSGRPAWRRVSRAYVSARALALAPLILLAGTLTAIFGLAPLYLDSASGGIVASEIAPLLISSWIALLALLAAMLIRWLAWRRTGYALDRDRILVRTGWLRRRLLVLPLVNIQSIELSENFVGRWFGICSIVFGVAGGRGFAGHNIPAIRRENARQLRDDLLSLHP